MLKKLDDTLPLAEPSNPANTELAGRFYLACRGVPDYLMTLVRGAAFEALQRGTERIDPDDLARVYEAKRAHQRALAEHPNPFVGELDAAALDRVQPLDGARVAGPDSRRGPPGAAAIARGGRLSRKSLRNLQVGQAALSGSLAALQAAPEGGS